MRSNERLAKLRDSRQAEVERALRVRMSKLEPKIDFNFTSREQRIALAKVAEVACHYDREKDSYWLQASAATC